MSPANIWNISDDKSDEEESISNDCTLYSENICFGIFRLWNEREKHFNTDYALTGWMLCAIPHIREDVFKSAQNKQNMQVNNVCSSPRKEKNSKPPTGENVVPCEQIIKTKTNGGKQGEIPENKSSGIVNPKSDPNRRQTKLVLRRPQKILTKIPAEVILRHQRKQRGIPDREYPLSLTSKYDPSRHQKQINPLVNEDFF